MQEQRKAHGVKWAAMPLEDAVMDVFTRVQRKEFLGQALGEVIYLQEVGRLLKVSEMDMRQAVTNLYVADRIDMNGMILTAFVPRFRLPWPLSR
jgi:hypothetical protein